MSSSLPQVVVVLVLFTLLSLSRGAIAQPSPPGSCPCPEGLCCSRWGFCGTTDAYCGADCASQCPHPTPPPPAPSPPPPPPPSPLELLINSSLFDELLLHRNDEACQSRGFYTYDAFITAAKSFPAFGNTGDLETRKRDVAAFLAQTSRITTGGWGPNPPDGPYTWGYCFNTDPDPFIWSYCLPSVAWPCVAGKQYYGRGPFQLVYNVIYGMVGESVGYDLVSDPDALANDAVLSFKSALWVWMTPRYPSPSCHDVMTGQYQPTQADLDEGRLPGYGLTTFLTNGKNGCAFVSQEDEETRVGFYKRYCDILGVSYGDNVECSSRSDFGFCGSHVFCPEGQCCSKFGFCGTTDAYCGGDCVSQCLPQPRNSTLVDE